MDNYCFKKPLKPVKACSVCGKIYVWPLAPAYQDGICIECEGKLRELPVECASAIDRNDLKSQLQLMSIIFEQFVDDWETLDREHEMYKYNKSLYSKADQFPG